MPGWPGAQRRDFADVQSEKGPWPWNTAKKALKLDVTGPAKETSCNRNVPVIHSWGLDAISADGANHCKSISAHGTTQVIFMSCLREVDSLLRFSMNGCFFNRLVE